MSGSNATRRTLLLSACIVTAAAAIAFSSIAENTPPGSSRDPGSGAAAVYSLDISLSLEFCADADMEQNTESGSCLPEGPTDVPSDPPTQGPTPEPTVKPSPKPSQKPDPESSCDPSSADEHPEKTPGAVEITGERLEDGSILLQWGTADGTGFRGYKVVASATDPYPSYPDDGYLRYITDISVDSLLVDGSFRGALTPGTEYYFSITVLYESGKAAGNAVRFKFLEEEAPQVYAVPQVSGIRREDGTLLLSWAEINEPGFEGYKVVASPDDPQPCYPDDGYIAWITDKTQTSLEIGSGCDYGLEEGTGYYFSVTALYWGHTVKVPGNSVRLVFR